MNINKIKKAFSCIRIDWKTGKLITLAMISIIWSILFSRHMLSQYSDKALHLPQNQEFSKTDLLEEDFINGKAFSGELMKELVVLQTSYPSRDNFKDVHIRSQNFINPANANNSKCIIQGKAYPISQRSSMGISRPASINIDFTEVTCEVNGTLETHKIDGHIWNIKAETVPASVAFKKKIQSLKNDLKTKTDEESIGLIKHYIKKIEVAGPALILPAHTQIQGAIIHQNNGAVVIKIVY